jgi:hypothetical protein
VPSAAIAELRRHPDVVFDVLQVRAYAATREQLLNAKDEASAPHGPLADLVAEVEAELFQERRARMRGEGEPDVE